MLKRARAMTKRTDMARTLAFELEYVEPAIPIHDVDQPAAVDLDIIGLRGLGAAARLGDEPSDFLRCVRVADVDDAEAAGEPGAVDQRALDVLLELVRAEATALA